MQIYKTINLISGKIYIGLDTHNNSNYLGSGVLINRAIKKYGRENFKKEIIEECSDINCLREKEIFWINFYNSTDKNIGYNITKGGIGGDTFSNQPNEVKSRIRNKMSVSSKGKPKSEQMKAKSRARRGKDCSFFGKHHTEESKRKISIANSGENNSMKKDWVKEKHFIATRKNLGDGNPLRRKGGHTPESRLKISNTLKGRVFTTTHRENQKKGTQQYYKQHPGSHAGSKNPRYGKIVSEQQRKKTRNSLKRYHENKLKKE